MLNPLLRKQVDYDNGVMTDAPWMVGIARKWNLVQVGNDMLLSTLSSYQMLAI